MTALAEPPTRAPAATAATAAATAAAGARMPLSEHLREARRRLTRIAVALALATVAGYFLSDAVLDLVRAPIVELARSRDATLNYDSVTGAFDLKLRIALFTGVVLSSPVWLYEIFAYLAPALSGREKKHVFGFVFTAVPLFAAGCVAGLLLFPRMVELLAGFASTEDSSVLQASYYVDFVMKVVIAVGVAFALPVFVVLLNFVGVLSARSIARGWRWWLIGIVGFSALATPAADVLSMLLVAVPMAALFSAALLVALAHDRLVSRRRAAETEGGR